MSNYLGDITLEDTIDCKFCTVTTTGAPTTLAGTPVISAYVGNSVTQITAGITLTVDFDAVTGLNNVRVVATAANGYAAASNYQLVITTGTVGGTSVVGYVVAEFSISARNIVANVTQVAGAAVNTASAQLGVNVVNAAGTAWGSGAITAASIAADAITAAKVADGTIDALTFAAGAINAAAIAADAITAAKVADGTIDAATFAAGAINATAIADSALDALTFTATIGTFTVGAGSTTTSVVTSAVSPASAVNDQYKGRIFIFDRATTTAALRGQATDCTAWTHATTTATVTALTTAPVSGDTGHIL